MNIRQLTGVVLVCASLAAISACASTEITSSWTAESLVDDIADAVAGELRSQGLVQ